MSQINKRKETSHYQLLNRRFNKLAEAELGVTVVDVLDQLGDDFGVGFRLESKALLDQVLLDFTVVGDNSVVNDNKVVGLTRTLRVGVHIVGSTMSGPTGVGNSAVNLVFNLPVQILLLMNKLIKHVDLANLAKNRHNVIRSFHVIGSIDSDTSRVVSTVLHPTKSLEEDLDDLGPLLRGRIIDVSEDSTHCDGLGGLV